VSIIGRLGLPIAMTILLCVGCAAQRPVCAPLNTPIESTVRADAPAAPIESLTLGTYNVHGLAKRDAIRTDLAALDQVNVWCLQEFPHGDGQRIDDLLPTGRWYVATIPLNREHPKDQSVESQVIASRFPIDRVEAWPLDEGGAKRRVALTAVVNANGRCVRIVNTDHQPSILAWRDGNSVQVRQLIEHLRACDDEAVLVTGDFNCSGNVLRLISNSGHARRIDAAMLDAGFASIGPKGTTFRSGVLRAHLDRIYARRIESSESAIAVTATGSDHLPVWTRFDVPAAVADRTISGAGLAQ
jgi:endonuclease/exonuclease/phosphatase family metal-dependent hydrolase